MSHFVYDNTNLDFPKTDLEALPPGADPTQYIVSTEWNRVCQAATDIKSELRGAKWIGLEAQGADPSPAGISNYLYLTSAGIVVVQFGVTTLPLVTTARQVATSGGLTGGGTLAANRTLSMETLSPTPAGTFAAANITVDIYGRVTAASSGVSGYSSMVNNISALTGRGTLEVDGSNLIMTDDPGNSWTALRLSSNVSITTITVEQAKVKTHPAFTGSQSTTLTGAIQTTDATVTEILSIPLDDNTVYSIEVSVIGRGTAGVERAMYGKKALFYREGTAALLQGAVQNTHTDVETTGTMDATISASGNNASITVKGVAATTINWVVTATVQGVSGNA